MTLRVAGLLFGWWLSAEVAYPAEVIIRGHSYTLQGHPRVFLDGTAGEITARVRDPDGAGPGVAPQASGTNPAFMALKKAIRGCAASPDRCSRSRERSTKVLLMALDWYMDNRQTASRDAAIHWLGNVETWVSAGYGFACDINQQYCGLSSWSDWPAFDLIHLAQAYSLVRSEMSQAQRLAFYQKIFNDDEVTYQDSCSNMLQPVPGAIASFSKGSSSVTGVGLSTLSPGERVYFRPSNAWATVASVEGPSVTLAGAPRGPLGGAAPSQARCLVYRVLPWSPSSCGLVWMLFHHAYAPADTIGRVDVNHTASYDESASRIRASATAGLPGPPFNVLIRGTGEVMKVTAIDGNDLSVERGQLNTTARKSQYPPRPVTYTRYIPNTGTYDYAHNLVIQKLAGALTAGLALADEGEEARRWVTRAADSWLGNVHPRNLDMWTGFQQGGSSNYGAGRQLSQNYMIVAALRNIPQGTAPSLNRAGSSWLRNQTDAFLYASLPDAPASFVPWGQPDIATSSAYSANQWAPIQTFLLGSSSDEASYWNYWQRDLTSQYTSANLLSGANERVVPFALMYWQESDPRRDYRATLPTEKSFEAVDGRHDRALAAWVSRSGWTTPSDTLVFAAAFSLVWTGDHLGTGAPGAYRLYKNGWLLSENGRSDTGAGADTNMLLFGASPSLNGVGDQIVTLDASASGAGWAFVAIDAVGAYQPATKVTRALRRLLHFKHAGHPDYLVVYDSAATSVAKTISQNLHFDRTKGQASTMTSDLPELVWTGPNRRITTKVVLPAISGVTRRYRSLPQSHRVSLCASSDGTTCTPTTTAEFLLVHSPSASASDTMPSTQVISSIDGKYVGVEIKDLHAPSVAVFSRGAATETPTRFTTTHGGIAQYVVAGLPAGDYLVLRDDETVFHGRTDEAGGVLAFNSRSGRITVRATVANTPVDLGRPNGP